MQYPTLRPVWWQHIKPRFFRGRSSTNAEHLGLQNLASCVVTINHRIWPVLTMFPADCRFKSCKKRTVFERRSQQYLSDQDSSTERTHHAVLADSGFVPKKSASEIWRQRPKLKPHSEQKRTVVLRLWTMRVPILTLSFCPPKFFKIKRTISLNTQPFWNVEQLISLATTQSSAWNFLISHRHFGW